jgi:steroid Delta-isomerase
MPPPEGRVEPAGPRGTLAAGPSRHRTPRQGGHAAFYDSAIAPTERIVFEIERSYLCGDEVADVGVVRATLSSGQVAIVPGVFTYRSDGQGRLVSSRAFWEYDAAEFEPVSRPRVTRT